MIDLRNLFDFPLTTLLVQMSEISPDVGALGSSCTFAGRKAQSLAGRCDGLGSTSGAGKEYHFVFNAAAHKVRVSKVTQVEGERLFGFSETLEYWRSREKGESLARKTMGQSRVRGRETA